MKARCIILFIALAVPSILAAQSPDLPREVKIQFMENYISASNVQWQKDRQDHYQARFTHQSQSKLSTYSDQGSWLYTETSMVLCQVPFILRETLEYTYNDSDILDVKKIETDNTITFRFTLKDRGEAEYALDGTLLSLHAASN